MGELVDKCQESSLPTHASPQCLSACAYFGLVLSGLIRGTDRPEVLDPDWPPLATLKRIFPLHPAYWGESGIPARWRAEVAHRDMIETALVELLGAEAGGG